MINCHFHEFDVTEGRAVNNIIIITSIIFVEIILHFVCVILFTFLRITCETEEHIRSG
jgi:type IV secretory pathway VirB3-like protein